MKPCVRHAVWRGSTDNRFRESRIQVKSKAFTLIELLVVIAIIALLLSIVLPGLKMAKLQAAASVCLAHNKQILTAWITYASENDSKLCGPGTDAGRDPFYDWVEPPVELGDPGTSKREEIEGIKKGVLYPYYANPELTHCPVDTRSNRRPTNGDVGDGGYRTFSFVFSVNQYWGSYDFSSFGWAKREQMYRKISEFRSAGSQFVLLEENDNRGFNQGSWVMNHEIPAFVDPFAVYHNMRSIMGYADGHAETQIWKDKRTEVFSKRVTDGGSFKSTPDEHNNNVDLIWLRDHYAKKK